MRDFSEKVDGLKPDRSLIDLLKYLASLLWGCYNGHMDVVNRDPSKRQIGLRGDCPHCSHTSYFQAVTTPYVEPLGSGPDRICVATQCQSCGQYVLAIAKRPGSGMPYNYEAHYPLGKPNDSVDEAVPTEIRPDFSEALRCHWIQAYRGTVTMCRRAIQASALEKGASPKKKLVDQIDELAAQGLITKPLQKLAHRIRLTGNVGAHPDEDGLADVTRQDADDIIDFTHQFFEQCLCDACQVGGA